MEKARPASGRRMRALAYTLVTSAIVLIFAFAEWAAERFVSERSRAAGLAIEIAIVLVAALVFRPVHKRVEAAVDAAFTKRKRHALAALERFRHELNSFDDMQQLLRRVVEAVEHYLQAAACAVYLRRDQFRAEVSSFDTPAGPVDLTDPLLVRFRSSGAPAQPPLLKSSARGTDAFPMNAGGDLIGFLSVECSTGAFDQDEILMLSGLAKDLAAALAGVDPKLRPRKRGTRNNLPGGMPPLVGREREIAEVRGALERSRLVTLTGAGGVGKTCLALHCAALSLENYEDGVWFVNLAPIADAALLVPTVLSALEAGNADADSQADRLIEYLKARKTLIIIDNCEQIVAVVAELAAQVGASCPGVTIVATSRETLHVAGEHVYRIPSLRLEAAAELFVQRASAAVPDLDLTGRADVVRSICEHLDGIPLAIELAAARTRTLSVHEIQERLHDRFRLLTGGARTALPRQQTLASLIEWSYDLLPPEEQSLFRRFGVFRGSFSLSAAAAVCAEGGMCDEYHILDVLTSLADKSLLTVTVALATRYRFLETIREFAQEKAAQSNDSLAAARQHAAHFAALASQAYHEFDSQLPQGWQERLAPDIDNFRAALEYTLAGSGGRLEGAQLAADCGPLFLRMELLSEGLRWCDAARSVPSLPAATAGRVEYVASMLHNNLGQSLAALECAQRAVPLYEMTDDTRGLIRALSQVAQLYARAKRFDDARAPATEAIRRARILAEPRVLIAVLRRCAFSLPSSKIDEARSYFEEALALARAVHDPEEVCMVMQWWAYREAGCGLFERAVELAGEALNCADHNSQMFLESQITGWLLALGRVSDAAPHARKALALADSSGHEQLHALAIAYCAALLAVEDPETAALLLGYAQRRLGELQWEPQHDDEAALENVSRTIAANLTDGGLDELTRRGGDLSDEALRLTLQRVLAGGREDRSTLVAG